LRRYGLEPLSVLATLENHEEDIHRTLNGLIDKGLVTSAFESPTVYTAVDLDVALETALKKHESELREMERRKQELQEMSKQQKFWPSDEFFTFKIIKSVREVVAATIEGFSRVSTVTSTKKVWLLCVVSPIALVLASLYGLFESSKQLIERGGVGIITDISYPYIELIQQRLDFSVDIRHYDQYQGVMYIVLGRRSSISAINANINSVSRNEPM
jgi:hypothetical protein